MVLTKYSKRIASARLPLIELSRDWYDNGAEAPPSFGFGIDPERFHFRARRSGPAVVHPAARPGAFTPELWKFDAAEFFIAHPARDVYLEFNLAPNGAWWSCLFNGPRCRVVADDVALRGVVTSGIVRDDGWEATASLPLEVLQEELGIDRRIRLNATFTLDAPRQRFFTHTPLGPGEPDFHQPSRLPVLEIP